MSEQAFVQHSLARNTGFNAPKGVVGKNLRIAQGDPPSATSTPLPPLTTAAAIMAALGLILFVDLEIVAAAAAAIWSLTGYFQLPLGVATTLAVVIGLAALWLCWKVAVLAVAAERHRGEEPPQ